MEVLEQTRNNQAIIHGECAVLLDTLCDMKETLSKFNTDALKEKALHSEVRKDEGFSKIRPLWADKKENLKKLASFVYTFSSTVSTELN